MGKNNFAQQKSRYYVWARHALHISAQHTACVGLTAQSDYVQQRNREKESMGNNRVRKVKDGYC